MTKPIDRQDFLKSLGRGGLLLGMTGLGISALHGTKDPSECFNNNYCQQCFVFHTCGLPEKKELKDERTQESRPA